MQTKILIPSAFEMKNVFFKEALFYYKTLMTLILKKRNHAVDPIIMLKEGIETISQIQAGLFYAAKNNYEKVIFVWANGAHYARWRFIKDWLSIPARLKVEHEVNHHGRPRPKEYIRDWLIVIYLLLCKIFKHKYYAHELKNVIIRKAESIRQRGEI